MLVAITIDAMIYFRHLCPYRSLHITVVVNVHMSVHDAF
jgi:hypothetical protein